MDKIAEIFSSLVEKKFSAQKIFAVLALLFINGNINKNDYKSFTEWIFNQNITIFSNFYTSLDNFKIPAITYTFFAVLVLSKIYIKINFAIINGQINQDDFIKKINEIKIKTDIVMNLKKRLLIKNIYQEDSNEIKNKLKNMSENGSTMFSFVFCSLFYFNNLGLIDLILISAIFAKSVYYLYKTTFFFIENNTKIIFIESISKSIGIETIYNETVENIS